jgi:hypothetical protein
MIPAEAGIPAHVKPPDQNIAFRFFGYQGGLKINWLATHDSVGRTQLPGA